MPLGGRYMAAALYSSRTLYGSSGSIEVSEQCQDDPEWILERMRCYVAV